jgi:mannose-6-phosphate isomerase-like protein (cupin superfamily)
LSVADAPKEPVKLSDLPGSDATRQFEGEGYESGVSFYYVRNAPGSGPGLHRHPYSETFVVESGEALFTVDGQEIPATGGDVVVAPAGAIHKFVNSGSDTLHLIGIHAAPRMEQEDLEG